MSSWSKNNFDIGYKTIDLTFKSFSRSIRFTSQDSTHQIQHVDGELFKY